MTGPSYIFAGGGTGGHLCPALAVAEELTALSPGARVIFACSDRDIDRRILSPTPHAIVPQPIRPMPRGLGRWPSFLTGLLRSQRLARELVADLRPVAVLGLGGFACGPVVWAAAGAGVRTALMSIDARPGRANRLLARRVDAIFTQFADSAVAYGRYAGKARAVGCPVRRALRVGDTDEARQFFGLRSGLKTLLVMAGSLGAASVNVALAGIQDGLDGLADHWQVLHVAGPGKQGEAEGTWRGGRIHHTVLEFCDRMDLAYAAADLVLSRSGAATVGELTATATPAVLMPYPHHRDRHQEHNAAPLAKAGSAVVVADVIDPTVNAEVLRRALLPILRDDGRLEAMQRAASLVRRSDAAGEIARFLAG